MASQFRVAVIGAGPAGLAAAHRLVSRGVEVELFEASQHVGGLARTLDLWGHSVDLGPHIFAGGPRDAFELWNQFIGDDPHDVPLKRGIATGRVMLAHPPTGWDLVRKLPWAAAAKCGLGLVTTRVAGAIRGISTAVNTEDWVAARYGQPLYDTLFRGYVEKLWGVSGKEIDARFAAALFGEAERVSQGVTARLSDPAHNDPNSFFFPRGGTGRVWDRIAERIRDRGAIHLNVPVENLLVDERRVVGLRAGGIDRHFDRVVSSMPLGRLTAALDAPPEIRASADSLQVRHAVIVHLRIAGGRPLGRAWVYVYDPGLRVGRIVDSRTWQGSVGNGEGVVTMEYWCGETDAVWTADAAATIERAREELALSGVLPGHEAFDGHVTWLRGVLPVPTLDSGHHLSAIRNHLTTLGGLVTIGRHGGFAFNSMADSMSEGIAAADRVMAA